ncbi:MAG: DUF1822 family protein [Cyanobacteriota bacterium]|nr:DUF1822 family protein [Cyanobacteriota bacterium]
MLTLPQQQMDETENFYLMFSSEIEEKATRESEGYSNNIASWNAYRYRLCLETFLDWLREFVAEDETQPKAWPQEADLPSFWEVLEGAAIQWGETRILLIATDDGESETFSIPGEWVDIFPADYYVAARVNLDEEESGMEICGYVTHRELKTWGRYNESDRSFVITYEELVPDIDMMLIAREFVKNRKAQVNPVVKLHPNKAEVLLEKLSDRSVDYPRGFANFEDWGGLLINDLWREQLYEKRLAKARGVIGGAATSKLSEKLGQWFDNMVDTSWQTIEELMDGLGGVEPNLAFGGVGGGDRFRDAAAATEKAIPGLLELLYEATDKWTKLQAATLLGRIGAGNPRAIAALDELLNKATDGELRRQIALSLGKINPGNPRGAVRRGKKIDLGMQLAGSQVVLVLTLIPESNGKTNVHLRLSAVGQNYLPPSIQLAVLSETGETVREAKSRNADNAIQLELRGDRDDAFAVKVARGESSITQEFII